MAIVRRFLLGCFNSLLGTVRAYASEICRDEHRALALSVRYIPRLDFAGTCLPLHWMHADKKLTYNSAVGDDMWGLTLMFPYFLPCLLISLYALGVFICCWWLPETLHMHNDMEKKIPDSRDLEVPSGVSDGIGSVTEVEEHKAFSKDSLFRNWPLMSTVIVYCVFSLQEIAYNEVFSLWAVCDKKYGGLSFSSQDVGEAISTPILASYPHINMLSGLILHIVMNFATMLRNALSVSVVTGIYIMLNNAVAIRWCFSY
ncbi:hypothetical protein CRG98_039307 [Punica granatum]|uniref:Uncharacterized protein n=1 Tax=Punica granatum TaxID=22663 RepID=A0A2I0I8I1_PUNGR|nr:hypothetical protein CRG98_039307 [Punica granatum]